MAKILHLEICDPMGACLAGA